MILETSQGRFHPQKEPVLASLEKGPKIDPYILLKSPNFLKIIQKVKISTRGEPLEGKKYTIRRQKMLENHEKNQNRRVKH